MTHMLMVYGFTFIVSLAAIAAVIVFSDKLSLFDSIDDRKIHVGQVSRLGGIGLFTAFVTGLVLFSLIVKSQGLQGSRLWFLIGGSSVIFGMGLIDDIRPMRARYKALAQLAAALIVVIGGFSFRYLSLPAVGPVLDIGFLRFPLTILWIFGVTNAVNLIDGLDGQAGTIAFCGSLTYAVFFYQCGNYPAMVTCCILAAAIAGFLCFNLPFPRAKIFMGDCGSQFLGFILAVLPLIADNRGFATISLPYASAVLIIPIFDTIAAIWRRLREHRAILDPDRFHIHHKLMLIGYSKRQTLMVVMLFQAIISILVISSAWTTSFVSIVLLFAVYLIAVMFFAVIHARKEGVIQAAD
jgi:UDP-GlcNAc:undecaprenyl-phosphate GlcNAc-1-phosphate transferase